MRLLAGAERVFSGPARAASTDAQACQAELFEPIDRLRMELEQLKKVNGFRVNPSGR